MEMGNVDVGFIEECESWMLQSRFFPSKVGGKPAWLNLSHIPNGKSLECKTCGEPCVFLCQVYAPLSSNETFHRTLFVFICKDYRCCEPNYNGNIHVIRQQMGRNNEFYPFDPPEEKENWRTDITVDNWTKTCVICGLAGPSHCAKCKNVNYCCKSHQIIDWKTEHKNNCNNAHQKASNHSNCQFLFPEFKLQVESEGSTDDFDNSDDDELGTETKEMEKFKSMLESGKAGTLQSEQDVDADLMKMSVEEDEIFSDFRTRIHRHPDQVLRYDRDGSPLYISSENRPENIPNCEECNGERTFEFQIMPQMLNYLGFSDVLKSIDWGILCIFTCKNSCSPKCNTGYCSEFIWKQDIIESKEC